MAAIGGYVAAQDASGGRRHPAREQHARRLGVIALVLAALVGVLSQMVGVPSPSQLAIWAQSAGPVAPAGFVLIAALERARARRRVGSVASQGD